MPAGIYPRKEFSYYFWNKVDKKEPNECWLWTGSCYKNGYGTIRRDGKVVSAHRTSYDLHHPLTLPISDIELFVCHKCDNVKCINPNHLFLGTQTDNMKDCSEKGRCIGSKGIPSPFKGVPASKVFGENHGSSNHKNEEIKDIREKYATGNYTMKELQIEYGYKSDSSINDIIQRHTWKNI